MLSSDLGPGTNGVKVDAAVDERSRKLTSAGLERVGTQGDRPLDLIGLYQLQGLRDAEQAQQLVQHELIVAEVDCQVLLELQPQQMPPDQNSFQGSATHSEVL